MVRLIERAISTRSLWGMLGITSALLSSACRYEGEPPVSVGEHSGNVVTPPDPPEQPSEPSSPAEIGARVFGDDRVIEVRLQLEEADRQALELDGDDEVYVPSAATLTLPGGSEQLARIGVRHKGAYTLHHCFDKATGIRSYAAECARLSYKLDFDQFVKGTRFDGLERLNLHASSADETRMREMLAYGMFRDFGVAAPRTALAKVYVNGEYEGLFIAVEEIDGHFTKANFPAGGDGNLFKELWPSSGVSRGVALGALKTNEEVGDVSAFLEFSAAIATSQPSTFTADMASWIDIEHTLRYVAVDRALKNWDGIMAFYSASSPHNFYFYHDVEGSGRFQLVPWDMDNTSWDFDPYMHPESWVTAAPVPDWNEAPASCNPRPIWDQSGTQSIVPPRCDRFLDLLAQSQFSRFQAISAELLAGPFAKQHLLDRVEQLSAALEPLVADDPLLSLSAWRNERENFAALLARSHDQFAAFVAEGLMHEQSGGSSP